MTTTITSIQDSEFTTAIKKHLGTAVDFGQTCTTSLKSITVDDSIMLEKATEAGVEKVKAQISNGETINPILIQAVKRNGAFVKRIVGGINELTALKAAGDNPDVSIQFVSIDTTVEKVYASLSDNTLNISPVTRGKAYESLIEMGQTQMAIAAKLFSSQAGISNHMMLARSGKELCKIVDNGKLKQSFVIGLIRKHGPEQALKLSRIEIEHQRGNKGNMDSPLSKMNLSPESIEIMTGHFAKMHEALKSSEGGVVSFNLDETTRDELIKLSEEAMKVSTHNQKSEATMASLGVKSVGTGHAPKSRAKRARRQITKQAA